MRFNPYMLIPIVLDVLVLAVLPRFIETHGYGRALFVSLVAMAWPWILYFVIGRILQDVVKQASREREESENRDFI